MINPTEKLKEIESRIIYADITHLDRIKELKGKTIADYVTFRVRGIPAIVFVTTDKSVYIESVYETWDSEDDDRDYLRSVVNKHKFLYMILDGTIDSNELVKVGVVNASALEEYHRYKREQEKADREKYAKEQEYKRYLELKDKFENGGQAE